MSSLADAGAWCPACGEPVPRRYPRCTRDRTPTPVYVEINALTQYLVGVPTFVEFRFLNAASEPVTLDSFEARLGGRVLPPGIHDVSPGEILPAEEQGVLVIDRRVELGIELVTPGDYHLEIELAYSHEGQQSRLVAAQPVRFAQALDCRIHVFNALTRQFETFEGTSLPETEAVHLGRIGEQTLHDHAVMHLCRLKQDAGLRFMPLPARLTGKEKDAAEHVPRAAHVCASCGARLSDGGFCHACGARRASEVPHPPPGEAETVAYCPHCAFPRGRLRGRYRYCPACGGRIDLHVSAAVLPSYMAGVQVRTPIRLASVSAEPVHITQVRAFLGEREEACPCGFVEDASMGIALHPGEAAELMCLVYSPLEGKTGHRKLTLELDYACGDRACTLSGSMALQIMAGAEKFGTIIHKYGAETVEMAGDAVMSQGTWSINQADSLPEDKRDAFMKKLAELADVPMRPVHLRAVASSTLGPAITWEPAHRSTLVFTNEGVEHRYCIATMYRMESGRFGAVSFGRRRDVNTFRLYEVEDVLERKETQPASENTSLSMVSSTQWVVEQATEAGSAGLQFTHRSKSNTSIAGRGNELGFGDSAILELHERIECRRKGANGAIIGLQYAAYALPFRAWDAARAKARAALETMMPPPERLPEAPGRIGGYRLDRLHSLTGYAARNGKDPRTMEAYILMPGWATMGSASSACIVVPGEGAAPVHAYLLHVDGYYFVLPHSVDTPVLVNGQQIPGDAPWPLDPKGTEIQLGQTGIHFGPFSQAFLR